MSSGHKVAQRVQERFRFYLVSLVFTVLVLAIQTAHFGTSDISNAAELVGWVLLLASGIAGLWSLESLPLLIGSQAQVTQIKERTFELQKHQYTGETHVRNADTGEYKPIEDLIKVQQANRSRIEPQVDLIDNRVSVRYRIHRYLLVAGFVSLIVARGYLPVCQLLRDI